MRFDELDTALADDTSDRLDGSTVSDLQSYEKEVRNT
jgi:hypothetical protein